METPTKTGWNWKHFALKWLSIGIGIGLIGVVGVGSWIWVMSRPKPPMPWNTGALIAKTPPSFTVHDDGKKLSFSYAVENTTEKDYQVDSGYEVKILVKINDGSFSQPLPNEAEHIELPVFIPAKQTGTIVLELKISGIPTQEIKEPDEEYHERVRAFCEKRLKLVKGFALFDEANRYQVDFPKWLSERPKEDDPHKK